MTRIRYFPAYLLNAGEYDDPESCLDARGCSQEQARTAIALAKIHQSEIMIHAADMPPHEFFLIIAEDGGKWRAWAARSNTTRETPEKAAELIEAFGQDVEWRVFALPQHETLGTLN